GLIDFLGESPRSHNRRYTPVAAEIDSVIDVLAVFQQRHREIRVDELPQMLLPRKGRFGLVDYHKVFAADLKTEADIFDLRAIDRGQGALVVVRPDQYVSNVLPLDDYDALTSFFGQFFV
ncbi:MAG: 3-hydroxybenzoate 4-monooxygenase, partial [Burkholderiales bacterium]|nr:3-hydroxybenzoate 4-monooxygenase [Burkholderiales bacterium]